MSIFSNKNVFETDDIVACEGYDITLGGHYNAIMESYDDDLAVIEAMHAFDMAEMEAMKESGSEIVSTPLMEASAKEIWDKIKKFFKNLWSKIVAFFQSAIDYVSSLVMSGTAFAKKYEERLSKLNLNGFTYEMYEYNFESIYAKDISELSKYQEEVTKSIAKVSEIDISKDNFNELVSRYSDGIESIRNKIPHDIVKKLTGETNPEKFNEALANKFRSGGKKKSLKITDLSKYIKFLKSSNGLIQHIKNTKDGVNKVFKEIDQAINKAANEAAKAGEGATTQRSAKKASLIRSLSGSCSIVQTYTTRYINAWSSVVKEATSTYKNLCFKALSYKPAK